MNDKAKEEKQSGNEDSMEGTSRVDNENSDHEIDGGVQIDHTEEAVEAYIEEATKTTGAVAWMTRNSIAANLFMFILLFGGFLGIVRSKQEILPEFDVDIIAVTVPYPGASPEEVEQGIVLSIEEELVVSAISASKFSFVLSSRSLRLELLVPTKD